MRPLTYAAAVLFTLSLAITGFAQDRDRLTDASVLANAHQITFHPTPHDLTNGQAHARFGIAGIDSIPNFNGQFFADGLDPNGNPNSHWYTNTVGNPPQMGGTTVIPAPLRSVNIELADADGNLRYVNGQPLIAFATPFVTSALNSPIFSNATFSSSNVPTQFVDAVQRASYFNRMKPDWHTLLAADPKPPVTLRIIQSAGCPTGPNFAGCAYAFALNGDGSCCAFILVDANALLNGALAVVAGDIAGNAITTKSISSYLFPTVAGFFGDVTNCCILGFHTYFFQPGTDPEKRWVFNAVSWISPGPLSQIFVTEDVAGLSHELTEIYNDPFVASDGVHNVIPWWLGPNGECHSVLESGDVLERLPNSLFPVVMNGFTYHPQNEALLQWFEFKSSSDGFGGAYSYPNTTLLKQLSPLQKRLCAQ